MSHPSRRRPGPWSPPSSYLAPIRTPRLDIRLLVPDDAVRYHRFVEDNRAHLLPWMSWAATELLDVPATADLLTRHHVSRRRDATAPAILGWFLRDLDEADGLAPGTPGAADGSELDGSGADGSAGPGHLIGATSLHSADPAAATIGLGWSTDHAHTGRGLATEATAHVLSAALTSGERGGWGFSKVHAETVGANVASRQVAKKLGLRREQRRRQHTHVDGVGIDDVYGWGVLADEWDTTAHRLRRDERDPVGVGPHPRPWPTDRRYDPDLLREGDRRNVADRYRWWRHQAIVDDLAAHANPFHVAIENWRHDNNIGTVVRNANAFGAAGVHVVGRRSWNRRGAMVTDRYLDIHHHDGFAGLAAFAAEHGLTLIGIDNLPGSVSIFDVPPPPRAVLILGQEGPGLSEAARSAVEMILHIPQQGSTRSINAGVASGIAMAEWVRTHGHRPPA